MSMRSPCSIAYSPGTMNGCIGGRVPDLLSRSEGCRNAGGCALPCEAELSFFVAAGKPGPELSNRTCVCVWDESATSRGTGPPSPMGLPDGPLVGGATPLSCPEDAVFPTRRGKVGTCCPTRLRRHPASVCPISVERRRLEITAPSRRAVSRQLSSGVPCRRSGSMG